MATFPEISGHRGAAGLAPENTIKSCLQAVAAGAEAIEIDVGMTRDGVIVVGHDPCLSPAITRDANGQWLKKSSRPIWKMTFEELQQFDVGRLNPHHPYAKLYPEQQPEDGARVPALIDMIKAVQAASPRPIRWQLEIKVRPFHPHHTASPRVFVPKLLDLITERELNSHVEILSFDWRNQLVTHHLAPHICTAFSSVRTYRGVVPRVIARLGGKAWCAHYRHLNKKVVKLAQALGLKVIAWTVDEKDDMRRLIDMEVDCIVSNRPDRLRQLKDKLIG